MFERKKTIKGIQKKFRRFTDEYGILTLELIPKLKSKKIEIEIEIFVEEFEKNFKINETIEIQEIITGVINKNFKQIVFTSKSRNTAIYPLEKIERIKKNI